jgi:four helix bundle protein
MRAEKLEELLIYTKALEGISAVSPLLKRPKLIRDFELHKQLSESTGKIPGHIGEGFGQGTDRHFAHYLAIARGSALETRGHLATAREKEYISRDEEIAVSGLYQDLADMLRGFIAYLRPIGRIAGEAVCATNGKRASGAAPILRRDAPCESPDLSS